MCIEKGGCCVSHNKILKRDLFVVDVGYACFGIYVRADGICSEAPPIAKWMRGKHIDKISEWTESKKGKIERVG